MSPRAAARLDRCVTGACAAYTVSLAGLALLEGAVAERHWLGTLTTYAPQLLAALPLLLLLPAALARRRRRALFWLAAAPLLLLGLLGPSVHWPRTEPANLRVLTFNIAHGDGGVDRIAATIRAADPDIVCLQEVSGYRSSPDPLPGLRAALPGYTFVRAYEVAIASRLPIVGHRPVRYPPPVSGRVALQADVQGPAGPFSVVCAHLNTSVTGETLGKRNLRAYLGRTAAVRQVQVDTLASTADALQAPHIVCGDFNTPARGRVYGTMTRSMTDAFGAVGLGFGWTYPARRPVLRIDHVFCGAGVEPVRCRVLDAGGSDHRGLLAELRVGG